MVKLLQQIEALLREQHLSAGKVSALWLQFGRTVRETREARGLSLNTVADAMGTSKSALSYLETGQRHWDPGMARKAIEALR